MAVTADVVRARLRWLTCAACRGGAPATVEPDGECWHRHRQAWVPVQPAQTDDGRPLFVDVGVLLIVARLLHAGAVTFSSCQADVTGWGFVLVNPATITDEDALLLLPVGARPDDQYNRGPGRDGRWRGYQFPGIPGGLIRPVR